MLGHFWFLLGKGLSHRVQNHNQHRVSRIEPPFWEVQTEIHVKMQCDKKSLITTTDTSKKHNLMVVGGYSDNIVDLCGEDNTDGKSQYLGKGHTILTKQPSQDEFKECSSESLSLLYVHRHTGTHV
jgi:hypothetical protein